MNFSDRSLGAALLFLFLVSCSSTDHSLSVGDASGRSLGAISIAAQGKLLRLGDASSFVLPDEKVAGSVRFGHDYWMDSVEVTQAEFQSLLGRNPSGLQGAKLPAVNVSWYDAVLFCNARSKRDGLDSVYEYASVAPDSSGSVWSISGLASHFDRSGWRLPTEAEWELAARAGSATSWPWGELVDSSKAGENAWYQGNAAGHSHEVATRARNGWGFHDLTGNVMEWVHDWKGPYPSDSVTDYAGPEAPLDVPEIPLKGGAFNYGLSQLRPSSRAATYAAYRSSRADYVGFRCVRGGFQASYGSASGQVLSVPPVTLLASDLPRQLGSISARLVFLNRVKGKGILSWVDYGEATPLVRSLLDKDPVFHPVISPDGQWVAWSTVLEGSTQTGHVKVRRLAKNDTLVHDLGEGAIPRWWVNGSDTFLVRVSSAMDNTGSAWGTGATTAQRWSNGNLTGSVQTWSAGSWHDGRSGNVLYAGYRRLKQKSLASGLERTLFSAPANGKAAGDTSQVCNVSSAPDSSGRSMFLDFGYSSTSSVVGRPYGIHEIAFVADSTGAVTRTYPAPAGEQQWEHLEWSNSPRWAVSAAIDGSGGQKNLYALDLTTGSSLKIASGEDLWQPGLWVGGMAKTNSVGGIDLDSAGAWNTPSLGYAQEESAIKLRGFFGLRDRIRIAAVGSSRIKAGIVAEDFQAGMGFNLGFSASETMADRIVIENYLLPHARNVKAIALSLMPGWMFSHRGDLEWSGLTASLGYRYDLAHGFWKDTLPPAYLERVASRVWPMSEGFDSLGTMELSGNGWGAVPPVCAPPASEDFEGENFQANWKDLMVIVSLCQIRGIHLVLVNFPQSPAYAATACMGKYGPSWEAWKELRRRILAVQASNPYFHFYDANADGMHDYPDSAAWNEDHLSTSGAHILSRRLDTILQAWIR